MDHLCYVMSCVCHSYASVHCCLVVTCLEKADHLALVCDVYCVFVAFPCGILGQVWYLIVLFPDRCHLSYFHMSQKLKSWQIKFLLQFIKTVVSLVFLVMNIFYACA